MTQTITRRELIDELDAGVTAAGAVVDRWEQGDLAGAVQMLEEWSDGAITTIAKASRRDPAKCTCLDRSWYGNRHDSACHLAGLPR